jgi:hypothetical protein
MYLCFPWHSCCCRSIIMYEAYFYQVQVSLAQFTAGSSTFDLQLLSTPDNLWKCLPISHTTCLKILTIYLLKLPFNSKTKVHFPTFPLPQWIQWIKLFLRNTQALWLCVLSLCFKILWTNLINCMQIYIRQTYVILTFTFLFNVNHALKKKG